MAHVLVIDDDTIILKLIESALTKEGHSSVLAEDAFAAIELINKESFDLIICDATMPRYSGYDLVETIRSEEKYKEIPILFLTGRREKRDVMRAIKVGADDYLIKPVDFDLFFAKIESLLSSKRKVHRFAETITSTPATWVAEFIVVGVSEQGLSFQSELPLQTNVKIKIECDVFNEIGIDSPILRITSCQPDESKTSYTIRTSFVGLTSGELQKIRVWANKPHQARRAS